jgi:transposase
MYGRLKRHEVQIMKRAGFTNGRIAGASGVSKRTVQRILGEVAVAEEAEAAGGARSRVLGRPSKAATFHGEIEAMLEGEPELPTVEVLHRLRGRGYDGGKSAVYDLVAKIRVKPPPPPLVRFEGLAGEFSQHDFGQVDVSYRDGTSERIHFFASRLKYSRWSEVRIVADERVESLVRALLSSFEAFGGVPLVAVFDNPKTIVLSRVHSKIEWNVTFGQVALDYRFAPELCTPRCANQKGSVENLVGFVKRSFFKIRRFHDRADLEFQLAEWHREVNEERPSRATAVTPAERMVAERERLRPLSQPPQDYALRFPVIVGPTAMVHFQGQDYSMPPASIGFPATLHLFQDQVRIVARQYASEHPRLRDKGAKSVLPEHRAKALAKVSGHRAKLYYKRQQLLDLGADAETMLTEIVHRHPKTWPGEVELLFDLLDKFGDESMACALKLAVNRKLFGAYYVTGILEREAI